MKDPTVFRYQHRRHVSMTTAGRAGAWSLAHTSFADWSQAAAAPQVFRFARQKLWDMVHQTFFDSEPPVLTENKRSGFRLDFWTICDRSDCYLSFSDDDGCLRLGHSGTYLMLGEALATGSDWRRYFRAWTADSLGGTWTLLADTEANAFIRSNNVTFQDGRSAWTKDFSHGEAIREGVDQSYSQLPCRLALLTRTNSSC
ncbi:non-reducing end alpha-L-arabinofuranosidase family hydrolase [Streptomyces canus]|uniref:non-reducing end alpha-L-arabinofuranosidase family hydrolase n=1 Tax=Streptomyces canus TaxID=58343 RepID=UPI0022594F5C|nr:non-reducing end alpha-L-arabinofuranosidase family hydrolase [Streptomyces canus]MCX4852546.1 non-reducing end alpha-L-arabinofuranosidase family hydrolase [Streptomyces canus]